MINIDKPWDRLPWFAPRFSKSNCWHFTKSMGDLQDPKMKVLYHIRPYFVGIFPYIGLKNRPYST